MARNRKNPYRFQIHCNSEDPVHCKVSEILSSQGRNLTQFIVDAVVLATQRQPEVTEWLSIQQEFLLDVRPREIATLPQPNPQTPKRKPTTKRPPAKSKPEPEVEETTTPPQHTETTSQFKSIIETDRNFEISFDESDDDDDMDIFAQGMEAFG